MPMKSAPQFGGDRCRHCPNGWVCSSAGEHRLHTAGVTGSIPVTPTIQLSPWRRSAAGGFRFPVVRKRNAPLGARCSFNFRWRGANCRSRRVVWRSCLLSCCCHRVIRRDALPYCSGWWRQAVSQMLVREQKKRHEGVHPARCATATVAGNSVYCDLGRARFSPYFM